MKMKNSLDRHFCIKFLIVLLVINYMIVTIVLKDQFLLKYIRDMILVALAATCVYKKEIEYNKFIGIIGLLLIFLCLGFLGAVNLKLGFVVLRRYIYPLVLLIVVWSLKWDKEVTHFLKFIVYFFSAVSVWGIFQAHILGDSFLMNLGYPVQYSPFYEKDMLYNSYYFGGFGIQRVVSTISNSNVCALILGTTLLVLLICYPYLENIKGKNVLLGIIFLGYLLTFSRSNFLALGIVGLFAIWSYIPYKKQLIQLGCVAVLIFCIVGIIQGKDGLVYQLIIWVKNSLTFTESSAAGRSSRWLTALNTVIHNPQGIGFGHVGSIASEAGIVDEYYSCENSFLAVLLDTGWGGFILYFGFLIAIILKLRKCAKFYKKNSNELAERICVSGYAVLLYLFVVMFFSNHIYDMEAISIIYIYVGISLSIINLDFKNIKQTKENVGC